MICFEVHLNGERLALAGIDGFAVLNTMVTWVRRRRYPEVETDLRLSVGGLDSNEEPGRSVSWVGRSVKAGDEIRIKIVEVARADPPRAMEVVDRAKSAAANLDAALRYVERAKREAADLKALIARKDGTRDQLAEARRRVAFLTAEARRVTRWVAAERKAPGKKKR